MRQERWGQMVRALRAVLSTGQEKAIDIFYIGEIGGKF